jgi:hypothetical protein
MNLWANTPPGAASILGKPPQRQTFVGCAADAVKSYEAAREVKMTLHVRLN